MNHDGELAEWLGSNPIRTRDDEHPDNALVSTYLSWLHDVRHRQYETVRSYRSTLGAWAAWLHEQDKVLATATVEDVEAFQVRARTKRGTGGNGVASTHKREIACLRMFYRWLQARGVVAESIMEDVATPTVKPKQPRPIPDDVWVQTWASDMPNSLRTAIGLGFFCGLRRAEVVSLTVDQLTDARIVDFIRKGGGEDTLPWRSMVKVYEDHLPHLGPERFVTALSQSRTIGGHHLTAVQEATWMNRLMRKHGLPFTPHQLRHSCATNLIRAGVPLPIVSRLMNHTSIETTMLYVKAGGDELNDWLTGQT